MNNVEGARPNIRIEIQNNASEDTTVEKMDVSENEEGEIQDGNAEDAVQNSDIIAARQIALDEPELTTLGFLSENDQKKLEERAKRFNLNPEDICNFSEQDLQNLRDSLGINVNNEKDVKFNTLHVIGLSEMTAQDLLEYFANYAPDTIKWIDETSCDVIWLDNLSAARALHFKTRAVRGMPARHTKDVFPREFLDEVNEEPLSSPGESILIKNKNREIELQNEIGEVIKPTVKNYLKNSVDISEITIPVPPGYWRLGVPHSKCKCLLIRYGLLSDKVGVTSEKFSKYYKNISNPSLSKISELKKKEIQTIFERNKELNREKNPWQSLAENWDRDSKFREREQLDTRDNIVLEKNSRLSSRLGFKRKAASEKNIEEKNDIEDISEVTVKQNKKKMPIMRMYADEEEENIKRKRLLHKLKKQSETIENNDRDLRSILNPKQRAFIKDDTYKEPEETVDLATKLTNRHRKMIFAIERDLFNPIEEIKSIASRNALSNNDNNTRERRYVHSKDDAPTRTSSRHLTQTEKELKSRERPARHQNHLETSQIVKIPSKTLHSDHMEQDKLRHSRRYRSTTSPVRTRTDKPRSKVAVVIKTHKKPTVASTIWSKSKRSMKNSDKSSSASGSGSEDSESDSDSSTSSDGKSESSKSKGNNTDSSLSMDSPLRKRIKHFNDSTFDKKRLLKKFAEKTANLKVTMRNDRYRTD